MTTHIAPRRTVGPAVATFFEKNFKHTKGSKANQPFHLEPWQRSDIDLIYEVDADGRRVWRDVLYGVARGNGKSPITSGIGVLELIRRKDSPEVYLAAGAQDQANILGGFARDFIETGPLKRHLKPVHGLIRYPHNRGKMKVLSADGNLQHGLSPSAALVDEWHVFVTEKQRELYYALASAMHKRQDSLLMAITTAGFNLDTQLGQRYLTMLKAESVEQFPGVTVCRDPDTRSLMIWRGAPDGADITDPAVWRLANPASWLTLEELAALSKRLPEHVFRRLCLNQWTSSEAAWLPRGAWEQCARTGLVIPEGASVCLGVDIGMKKDSTAVVTAWPVDP